MIEHALDIAGPTVPMARRLDVAGALVHTLIAGSTRDSPLSGEALTLLEELALPAAVFDAAGRAPWLVNGAWRALFGAHERPPAGRALGFGVRDRSAFGAYVDKVVHTGVAIHVAELELGLDGPPAYCAATLRPMRRGAGATTGAIVLCALITDEVVARRLAVSAGTLVWSGPGSGRADYFNRAWCAYAGHASEPRGQHAWQDAIHAGDLPRCTHAFGDADRRRVLTEVEARVRRADGGYRWHRIRFSITTPGPRWFGTAADIDDTRTEAERTEVLARERAARAAAEQTNRLKDRFLAAVSHELRTPITTMLLWEKVLRDDASDAALHAQALAAIHESALSQSRLVGDLLDVSRAISGKLHVDLRPLDIERVLHEALEEIAPAALARQIVIERRGAPIAAEVQGDGARLRQVLGNLLSNAVKFTDPGGRVAVAGAYRSRSIVIDIQDSGRGIAPEFLPRLFEPFSQTDDSLTRQAGGLGLGLAIAKQLVALHGGDLTATSPGPGRGATFTLTLPIAAARGAPLPQTRIPRASKLDRVRILVVDDDPRVRDALALLLDRVGARVDTADSAESARARVALHRPEILVCDIAMPGEDGYSFIRRLRASGQKTPAIALTAYAMESDAKQALAAGYDLHLAKPVDFDRLVENIRELIAPPAIAHA